MNQARDLWTGGGTMVEMAGQTIVCRVLGEQTGGALALLETTLGPGLLGAPPHMHRREDEVTVVLEGELMVQVGERLVHAAAGDFVFKPRGVRHAFWNPGAVPTRFLEFITPAGFEEFFRGLALLFPAGGAPDVPGAVELARQYEVDFDLGRLSEIVEQYNVKPAWIQREHSAENQPVRVSHSTASRSSAQYVEPVASPSAAAD